MKLLVKVVEARNLRAMDLNGLSDPYVQLQLGKQKYRTKTVKKNLNPSWGEEFSFRVEDLKSRLHLSVWDEDKYFNNDLIGKLRVPISKVFDADNKSLGTCWYTLQPKTSKSKNRNLGEILLTISLSQNNSFIDERPSYNNGGDLLITSSPSRSSINFRSTSGTETDDVKEDKSSSFTGRIAQMFQKNGEVTAASTSTSGRSLPVPDHHLLLDTPKSEISEEKVSERKSEDQQQKQSSSDAATFEELIKTMEAKHQGVEETPTNLPGGILLDQSYMITPSELNSLLFGPDSKFIKDLAELQGTTECHPGPWRIENDGETLKRVLTYIKAASKLIKAVKATEEQTYLKADGKFFAVLASVSTPDVIYGSTFKTELLFCIAPGPELPSGEPPCSRLIISWRMNFLQSTMMKGMIEGGARQGLKESFEGFVRLLSQNVRPVDSKDLGSNKEQVLASLEVEPQSDWKLATQYLLNFTVISTVFMGLYVLAHILLSMPSTIQGIEFEGLDLPDSIGEVIVSGVLVLQGKRVLEMMARFMQARVKRGNDHGVKAQGDGWLLTVALIEGSSLAAIDSTGFSDPYVVFTCNGKTKTSSIKFQKIDPQWNEVFEFDAMDEPPSMLAVEVFDFDGPFYEATSLGRAEINFLKAKLSDLADICIPLEGKLAQACQSKVHLRIFLNNTRGSNVVQEYLTKMEKEVGKKINLRSPQTNSAFQKLFGLPPEEFLINDFTCHLKRKMLLQGRLFLSARIIGFHANLFGHRTRFFFLWEDIEDIQVLPPTLSTMGSPTIIIILRPGRGVDAKHGAKIQDEQGRLKFHFHSFVSYNVAHRTIMALWKSRALTPEQKVQLVEEEYGGKCLQSEESGSFLVVEDVSMSEIYSSVLHVPTNFFMELFSGGKLDHKVLEKVGCVNYSHTQWESVKPNVYQREVGYKLDKNISQYRGEVTSTQQKSPLSDTNGWVIEEVMTLQGVPLGDYFTLHVRYQIEDYLSRSQECKVQVSLGVAWQKSTKHQNRITKNIVSNLTDRLKSMFSQVEKEYVPGK